MKRFNKSNFFIKLFEKIDYWLCLSLPWRLRLWWCRLWIRKDEFHPSLDINIEYASRLSSEKEHYAYLADLRERRETAHERDMATY